MNHSTAPAKSEHPVPGDMRSGAALLSASTVTGDDVCNLQDESLGTIHELMFDVNEGKIRYAVLSAGGFMGMGDRLFAIPWKALKLDNENNRFVLDIKSERLKDAPGFDKNDWPNMADSTWTASVDSYYAR